MILNDDMITNNDAGLPDLLPPMKIHTDRDMLLYLMGAFDSEFGVCPRCGHEEPTKHMDSARFLRDYLLAAPQPPALTEEQMRAEFEESALAYTIERRAAGMAHHDNGAPSTRESLFWRTENGAYGVILYNPAWWAWKEAMKKMGRWRG